MLSGWEWIVILGVAAIVILWGPAKIPELANCKNQHEATKLIEKLERDLAHIETVKKIEDDRAETPTDVLKKRVAGGLL